MPSIGAAKQALLLAQIMHTAAYSALNVARPLRPVQLPSLRPRQLHAIDATATRSSHKVVLRAAAEAGDDVDDAPAPTGLRAKLKKAASFKKGDLAKITKVRPKGPCACGKELFTDSDTFTVRYAEGVGLTPQQKAAMMGSMILTDYMFFEQDQGMVTCEGTKIKITLFECYCCGALCPATIQWDANNSGGGGAPPSNQEMAR